MTKTKKKPAGMASLVLILFAITLVASLLLGLVNSVTKDKIAEINEQKTASAMQEVFSADSYDPVEYTGGDSVVKTAYLAMTGGNVEGYVVEVAPTGFGGAINMVVGIDLDGIVTGVSIIKMTETAGLGTLASEESYRSQYVGGSGDFAVNKDGGTIDALTGATVTSRAVTNGVNSAVEAAKTLG